MDNTLSAPLYITLHHSTPHHSHSTFGFSGRWPCCHSFMFVLSAFLGLILSFSPSYFSCPILFSPHLPSPPPAAPHPPHAAAALLILILSHTGTRPESVGRSSDRQRDEGTRDFQNIRIRHLWCRTGVCDIEPGIVLSHQGHMWTVSRVPLYTVGCGFGSR